MTNKQIPMISTFFSFRCPFRRSARPRRYFSFGRTVNLSDIFCALIRLYQFDVW